MLKTQCQISNNTQFRFVTKSYNIGIIQKIMYILLLVQHMDKNFKISIYFCIKKNVKLVDFSNSSCLGHKIGFYLKYSKKQKH